MQNKDDLFKKLDEIFLNYQVGWKFMRISAGILIDEYTKDSQKDCKVVLSDNLSNLFYVNMPASLIKLSMIMSHIGINNQGIMMEGNTLTLLK